MIKLDITACQSLNTLETILQYLYSRYGTFSDVSSQELDHFIKNAPSHDAKDDQHLENIHKFLGMIMIFRQESNPFLG